MVLLRKMLIIKKEEGIVRYRVYTSDKEYEIFVEAMDEETINCIKDTGHSLQHRMNIIIVFNDQQN